MEKVVGFVGYECEDIVLYLAKIWSALGKRVVIIDRTEQEMLLEILDIKERTQTTSREGDYSGVWITDQSVCYDDYDLIFYLFGYRLIHPKLYECGVLIMVTDGVPAHASLLRKIGSWDRKQYLLVRNLVPMKHTEDYLALLASNEENHSEIPYDEKDIRMRYHLGSYEGCVIRRLSAGMKENLVLLVRFLSEEWEERLVREIIKKL